MSSLPGASRKGLPAPPRPIHALTGLRFVAALLVFLHHAAGLRYYEGFCGVTFFYVLSGFILTYNYHHIFACLQPGELWSFYGSRLARIYPVHLLTFLAIVPLHWSQIGLQQIQIATMVKNLTLTQSFSRSYFSFNAVAWSLSDELFFYATLPFILWGLWKLRLNRAIPVFLTMGMIWFLALWYVSSHQDGPHAHWRCYINPLLRLGDFLIGVLLGRSFARRRAAPSTTGFRMALLFTGLEVLAVAGLAILWKSWARVPLSVRLGPYYTPAMASIVFVFAFERGALSRAAGSWLGQWLGEISFSFYMFHQMIIQYLMKYRDSLYLGQSSDRTVMMIAFAGSVAVAGVCYFWYENPMRRKVRLLLVPSRRSTVSVAGPREAASLAPAA